MPKKMTVKNYKLGDVLKLANGEVRIGPARAVLLTESAFVFLQRVIHEQMPEFVLYGFYEMGFRAGIDISKQAKGSQPQGSVDQEGAFRLAIETYRQAGYGEVSVVSYNLEKPEVVLRARNLLESSAARQSGIYLTPRAVDHYSRGMFAGVVSDLLGKEVICEEMKCEFRGDEACEFTILPFSGIE